MSFLVQLGLCELAVAGLMGWIIVVRLERPELLTRIGVESPRRLLQAHLDYVMMGLIAIAVGLTLPGLQDWIVAAVAFGTVLNPFLFLPLAWDERRANQLPFRVLTIVSFVAMSGGLVAAAIDGLSR